MSQSVAVTGARIFDGEAVHRDHALVIDGERIAGIYPVSELPGGCGRLALEGGTLAAAYIDLQVNGGGGVLFNESPSLEGIKTICAAHARFGTGAMLATLITDTPQTTSAAIAAAIAAVREGVPGFLGLHLEGPHLSAKKKGVHDPGLIRPLGDADLAQLLDARERLPFLMVTVAPDAVAPEQISALSGAGVVVSLGHSDATFLDAQAAAAAGACCVTHLFNAMSPLSHREPGMVGAALRTGELHAGLIADGFHVDPAAISIALAAKKGPGRIFLVTDAMSTIGTELDSLVLGGRKIWRKQGRLTLEDGTLAGADLDMNAAVMFMKNSVGIDLDEALRMASLYPARCIGAERSLGSLKKGRLANIVHLNDRDLVERVWIHGRPQ